MVINQSVEDYLEAVLIIRNKKDSCRSIDIANLLSFSKASVSVAISKLSSEGYLVKEDNGQIYLTDKGMEIAERIYERHTFFSQLFQDLGVSEEVSFEDACEIEHTVSNETFTKLRDYFKEHPVKK